MTEFKKYVERQESVEAFQFLAESQAMDVVHALGLVYDHTKWSLNHKNHSDFDLTIKPRDYDEVYVKRGDYIVRSALRDKFHNWIGERTDVVPYTEFLQKWQEA